ncbi:hypothetical protein ACLI4U_18980 (plasmid) [Natrialbaceae archaeon A-CW2]
MKRAITVFLAIAMALSVVGLAFAGGALATDHTTTLTGDDTDEATGFTAADDEYLTYTLEADGADFGEDTTTDVYLNITYELDDDEDVELHAESSDVDDADADYEFNVSHDELEQLPGDAGEITEITVNAWGEDADGTESTALDTFGVDLEFDDSHAVRTAFDTDDEFVSEFEQADEDAGWFGLTASSFNVFDSSLDDQVVLEDDVGIAGTNTTVHTYAADSDMTDVYDETVEDMDDGDRVGLLMTSSAGDSIVYVFNGEPGETITGDDVDEDEDTYAVYHGDGHMEWNLGEDRFDEDDDEVTINSAAGIDVGTGALMDDLDYTRGQAWGLTFLPLVGMLAGGIVVTRRRTAA